VLSYTFGLRHALDADHISVIDLMTRRLIADGSRPVTVGMFFSLGHSTIVMVTCIVVAATSGALEKRFDGFQRVGNIVGTSVSASVLILLGVGNAWILVKLVGRLRKVLREEVQEDSEGAAGDGGFKIEGGGVLVRVLNKVFKVVDRPWKMYPVGVLFGLGFDTSSEIAIIGIASIQGAQGTSIWLILLFPILFTGMPLPYFSSSECLLMNDGSGNVPH
jgi:high-affinity nickel-transport protein